MKNAIAILMALILGLAITAAPAYAQTFEIGAKLGYYSADELDKAAPAGKEGDDNMFTYGLIGQYNFDANWGIRLEIEMGTSEYVDSTSFILSGVYSFASAEDASWVPYAKLGILMMDVDVDIAGAPDIDSEFGFELGIGVSYIYENWKFFGEVGYRSIKFEDKAAGYDFDMNGFIIAIGVMYCF